MANTLEQLKQTALDKGKKLQQLTLQGADMTSEERATAAELNVEIKDLRSKIELLDQSAETLGWLNTTGQQFNHGGKVDEAEITQTKDGRTEFKVKGLSEKQLNAISSTSYVNAFQNYLKNGQLLLGPTEYKTLQEGSDQAGGFLVPEQIQQELISRKPGATSAMDHVRRLQTSRDNLVVPRNNYTADTTETYTTPMRFTQTGEIPAAATTADVSDATFGQTRIDIHNMQANVYVTRDMLEDSMFDMNSFIAEALSDSYRAQTENYIINGNGVAGPYGILAGPGTTIAGQVQPAVVNLNSGGATNALDPNAFITMAYGVPPQYEDNLRWIFNKQNTAMNLFKFRDTTGRYLFAEGYQDSGLAGAKPKELLGYPYHYSSLMPNGFTATGSGSTGNYPVIFGDFRGYYLVERVGFSIMVLDQVKALQNQVVMMGRWRLGGAVVEDWRLKVGKVV